MTDFPWFNFSVGMSPELFYVTLAVLKRKLIAV